MKIETHCKNCVWSVDNKCEMDRLEKFEKLVKIEYEDGYAKFPRFCNAWRNQAWIDNQSEPMTQIELEMRIGMGLVVDFTNNHDLKQLEKTFISCILGQYLIPNYVIVINDKVEYQEEIDKILVYYFKDNPRNIIQILDLEKIYYMDEAFKFARHGYTTFVYSGDILPYKYLEIVNNHINKELKFLSACFSKDEKIIFQNTLFKLLGGNKPVATEGGSINRDDFLTRLLAMKSEEKCIYLWDELFGKQNDNNHNS